MWCAAAAASLRGSRDIVWANLDQHTNKKVGQQPSCCNGQSVQKYSRFFFLLLSCFLYRKERKRERNPSNNKKKRWKKKNVTKDIEILLLWSYVVCMNPIDSSFSMLLEASSKAAFFFSAEAVPWGHFSRIRGFCIWKTLFKAVRSLLFTTTIVAVQCSIFAAAGWGPFSKGFESIFKRLF